ncbi:MAG: Ax21 family protein [Thermomonas sp.]|jgi:Ax21 family sulfation-dependent quorum factor|uniref:diffusible signal factor-reguated Ax21 faimly protein n=1 Tax=Thermomonas sp. TaxID=1971895 RepID=UPI001EB667C7|nr:diffusible signal factor-reguated Ax21 faimly protein [Thermomonas sp.]MBV2208475.1 Ax21 family protein [Thermomonas sp.]
MKRFTIALALAAALPFAATAADGINYNYVQGGYVQSRVDGHKAADGYGVAGSVAVHPNVHVFGSYANQDIKNTNVDFDQWTIGAGYNKTIGSRTDFVANAAYEKVDAGHGINADGYSVEGGVRSMLASNIEGYALLGYADGDDIDGDVYGRFGATAHFTPNWGVDANVRLIKGGDTQWFIGPRFSW